MRVDSTSGFNGEKAFGNADFGTPLADPPVSARCVLYDDGVAPLTSDACEDPINGPDLVGKIAIIDRGTCPFVDKAQRAWLAGAAAVVIVNNVASPAVSGMTGADPGITIPVVMVSQADGNNIKSLISLGVVMTIGADNTQLAGTDTNGRLKLYSPNPLEPGSSVSHWDVSATPNLLMEPFINPDLTGVDMTRFLFEDIGWFPRLAAVGPQTRPTMPAFNAPNPFRMATSIRFQLAKPGFTEVVVYDVRGAIVRRLLNAFHPAGPTSITWDGSDANGQRLPAGIYMYRVKGSDVEQTGRMTLMN